MRHQWGLLRVMTLTVDSIYHPSIFTHRGRGNTRQEGSPFLISSVASDVAPAVPASTDPPATACSDVSSAIDDPEDSTLPDAVCDSDMQLDQGLECRSLTKPNGTHKRKARRKAARKRTPKTAILPQKRMISSDNIQENIQQLNNQFFTIKAKRRRLYVKEQSMNSDQTSWTDRVGTSSSTAADRDDPLAACTAHFGDQPALTTPLNGHAAPFPEHSDRTLPSAHSPSSIHKGIQIQSRTSLHRVSKSKAITAINALTSATPPNAYRIPSIVDCPSVEVSIAESTLEDAGLGLFLTMGPSADGSAPPGTLLATYSGVTFTSPADRARVTSRAYKSDYLFEGLNPFTNTITIIDASNPRSGYGRYSNDSATFAEANAEFVFGEDGNVYLRALTTIPRNGEIFVNYGSHYWTDPDRWPQLPEPLRLAILQYYNCEAPPLPLASSTGTEKLSLLEAIGSQLVSNGESVSTSSFLSPLGLLKFDPVPAPSPCSPVPPPRMDSSWTLPSLTRLWSQIFLSQMLWG